MVFPGCFFQIGEEVWACRENVVVIDMSYFGKFFLIGPDAQKLVNWTFSGDMQKGEGKQLQLQNVPVPSEFKAVALFYKVVTTLC